MANDWILAIDQGTTNTKAIALADDGTVRARASVPMPVSFPQPGWVEQDPRALWSSVLQVVDGCLKKMAPAQPAAIGISNQRETVLAWERAGSRPLGPAIIWQCRRTADFCEELRARGLEPWLRERTGLTVDPLFSASKASWLLRRIADERGRDPRADVCVGTVDAWLLWNLTGGAAFATDVSNAARTQLLNLRTAAWDPEILALFEVPETVLPEVRPSSGVVGESVALGRLHAGIPIASMIGDSHAALFGQRGFLPGSIKATYGTGSSLMTPLPELRLSSRGLSSTVAWSLPGRPPIYALEGNITVTGAAVQWFGQFVGGPASTNPVEAVANLARDAGGDTGGVYVVPTFAGLGAPHWNESARGLICGLTRGSTPAHVARAVLDSIAYQVQDVFAAMQADSGAPLVALLADGGATSNDDLMQFQADLLGVPVQRNASPDVSALGAGFLAGLGVGLWRDLESIAALPRASGRVFEPRMDAARRTALLEGWRAAVARAALSV